MRTWHLEIAPRTLILGGENRPPKELDDVKAKLDSVHKLLKKQVSFAEDVEAVDVDSDRDFEEDVNFISGTGFQSQKPGNQNGYINSYGNGPRCNFNNNKNRAYESSSYQNITPQTRENKLEAMIDQVLESQQKLMVNVNGKIDDVYTELNTKLETFNSHVKKLET